MLLTEINIYVSIAAVPSYLIIKYQIGINNSWWWKVLFGLPYYAVAPMWLMWFLQDYL